MTDGEKFVSYFIIFPIVISIVLFVFIKYLPYRTVTLPCECVAVPQPVEVEVLPQTVQVEVVPQPVEVEEPKCN